MRYRALLAIACGLEGGYVNRYLTLLAACAVLASLMACKLSKDDTSDEKPPASATAKAKARPPAPTAPSAAPAASASAAPKQPEGLFADKLPAGLPPVDRSPVPVEALKQAGRAPLHWERPAALKPRNALMVSASFGGGCSCLMLQT